MQHWTLIVLINGGANKHIIGIMRRLWRRTYFYLLIYFYQVSLIDSSIALRLYFMFNEVPLTV